MLMILQQNLKNIHSIDYDFRLIGIYSTCSSEGRLNRTQQNLDAEMYHDVNKDITNDFARYFKGLYKRFLTISITLTYVSYEVCNDNEKLTSVTAELLLDQKYELQNPETEGNDTSVVFIFTHLPSTMSRFVYNAFSFTNVPVHLFELVTRPDGSLHSNKFEEWTRNLIELTSKLNWEDLFLVSITTDDDIFPYHAYYNYSIDEFVKHRKCIQLHKVTPNEIYYHDYFNSTWLKGHSKPAIVLFGRGTIQASTLHYLTDLHNQTGTPVMTQDVLFSRYMAGLARRPSYFFNTHHQLRTEYKQYKYGTFYQRIYPFPVITRNTTDKMDRLKSYMIPELGVISSRIYTMFLSFVYFNRITVSDQFRVLKGLREDTKESLEIYSPSEMINEVQLSNRMVYSNIEGFFHKQLNQSIESLGTKCPQPICGPGRYKVYGEISGGYGYRCDLCPVNHYKTTVGDDGCISCRGRFSIDNGLRTKCIDPYKDIYANVWESVLFKLLLSLNILGLICAIGTMGIFTMKRKTPVVVTSDFTISIIHMCVIALIFLLLQILQITSPSLATCSSRIAVTSVSFILNVSIVFIKSQKLLKAFLSKVLITEKEARNTKSQQIFFVITSIVIANAIFVITYIAKLPFSSYLNHANMKRVHYCDTSLHINAIIGFVMIVQFGCFVQAFR